MCVYTRKVPFRMDEESMVQRLTRIKELNGKLSTPASATVEICISHLAILYNAAAVKSTDWTVNYLHRMLQHLQLPSGFGIHTWKC